MQTEAVGFEKILKGYLGFLEGTGKSRMTISSYRGDLEVFRKFIHESGIKFQDLTPEDFDRYHFFLQNRGLKTNTRRRKLITARSLCRYAFSRKKIEFSPAKFIKPPERMERLPWLPSAQEVASFLELFPAKTPIGVRNRLLVEMIAETALSVSELCSLSWSDIDGTKLHVPGKRARTIFLSEKLDSRLQEWKKLNAGKYLYPGYNRHGMATLRMSPRGVELMFRAIEAKSGLSGMVPKTLRHFCVVEWLRKGVDEKEIQRRLGVSNAYSLQAYREVAGKKFES
jgi:site-specific recombinase XerD